MAFRLCIYKVINFIILFLESNIDCRKFGGAIVFWQINTKLKPTKSTTFFSSELCDLSLCFELCQMISLFLNLSQQATVYVCCLVFKYRSHTYCLISLRHELLPHSKTSLPLTWVTYWSSITLRLNIGMISFLVFVL